MGCCIPRAGLPGLGGDLVEEGEERSHVYAAAATGFGKFDIVLDWDISVSFRRNCEVRSTLYLRIESPW